MDGDNQRIALEPKRTRGARKFALHNNQVGPSDKKFLIAYSLLGFLMVTYNIDTETTMLEEKFKKYMPSIVTFDTPCACADDTPAQPHSANLSMEEIFAPTIQKVTVSNEKTSDEELECVEISFVDCVLVPLILLIGLAISITRMEQSITFVVTKVQRPR